MLNIKTLIQSIYSYIISSIKKSYKAFIVMTAIVMAGVIAAGITSSGNAMSDDAESENEEICVDELETGIIFNGTMNGQWESEKEYYLSVNDNFIINTKDEEASEDISNTVLTEKDETIAMRPLSGNTYGEIVWDTILDEEIKEDVSEEAEKETDVTTEEIETENGVMEETESEVSDEVTNVIYSENDVEEMSDKETAELLAPGDIFEGSDGTILVANKLGIRITYEDYECLLKIVQAEAGDQGTKGEILVVNVIVNRVKSSRYPDDIQSVVFQKGQFTPTRKGGSYYKMKPNKKTIEAVNKALSGVDYSKKALYFCCKTSPDSMFNTKLTFLFKYKDHYFYK